MSDLYLQNALSRIQCKDMSNVTPRSPNIPPNYNERQVKSVPAPATHKPKDEDFYVYDEAGNKKPNHSYLKHHFFREGRLTEAQALFILERATELLEKEPNMVEVKSPVTICGDIHGQYYDLMKLFEVGGSLTDNSYLFLGDYVDRGCFGIECLLYLYTLKIWFPTKFILLRGNHECHHLTEYFTFKVECGRKYPSTSPSTPSVYQACLKSFRALPIAALVDGRFFCVHGGISPELITLDDVDRLDRFVEPASHGLLCDLLWADPIPTFGHEQEPSAYGQVPPGTTFVPNPTRGCSFYFTYEAACAFIDRNNLMGIIRGHEAQDAGYTMHRKTPTKKFPSVITIFSAPNYLDAFHNRGAVIKYANKNITIRQYNASGHPYWLPGFVDGFSWSLPFVGLKITEMLLAILSICSEEELEDSDSDETSTIADLAMTPTEIQQRRQQIKNKILAVGRMQRVFQLLREEAENASELTDAEEGSSSNTLMLGNVDSGLGVQGNQIRRSIRSFDDARRSDLVNERLPTFDMAAHPTIFPVPSMRVPRRRASGELEELNMETLIKKTLDEEAGLPDSGVVERIAERIARGRRVTGRPRALKRHETA